MAETCTPFAIDGGICFFSPSIHHRACRFHGPAGGKQQQVFNSSAQCARSRKWSVTNCRFSITHPPVGDGRGSLSPDAIVAAQDGHSLWHLPHVCHHAMGCGRVHFVFFSESRESQPHSFDVPEGESEIVAGHMTEYFRLQNATFSWRRYFGMFRH